MVPIASAVGARCSSLRSSARGALFVAKSVALRPGGLCSSIQSTSPAPPPITSVSPPASEVMEDSPASSSSPAEHFRNSTPLPIVVDRSFPLPSPAPCATVYDLGFPSIHAEASPIISFPSFPVDSDSRLFCGFPTPFPLCALDIHSSPASFSRAPWFWEHGPLEFHHLCHCYADLFDMFLGLDSPSESVEGGLEASGSSNRLGHELEDF